MRPAPRRGQGRTMGRKTGGNPGDVRKSALWGSGNRGGEHRSNALWGKGGRGAIVTMVAVLMLSLGAGSVTGRDASAVAGSLPATSVEPGLLERAQASPKEKFRIIVQSARGADGGRGRVRERRAAGRPAARERRGAGREGGEVGQSRRPRTRRPKRRRRRRRQSASGTAPSGTRSGCCSGRLGGELDDRFDFIGGVSVEMSGRRLAKLARVPGLVITEDVEITLLDGGSGYGSVS